jgi:hypothetical protein
VADFRSWFRKSKAAQRVTVALACLSSFFAGGVVADTGQTPVQPVSHHKIQSDQRMQDWSTQAGPRFDVPIGELDKVRPPSSPSESVLEDASPVGVRIGEKMTRSAWEVSERTVTNSEFTLRVEEVFERIREAYCLVFAWFVEKDQSPTVTEVTEVLGFVLPLNLSDVFDTIKSARDLAHGLAEARSNNQVASDVAFAFLC